MILLKERIGKMLEYLQEQVYPKQVAIPSYKMIRTDERCLDVNNLDTLDRDYEPGTVGRTQRILLV